MQQVLRVLNKLSIAKNIADIENGNLSNFLKKTKKNRNATIDAILTA